MALRFSGRVPGILRGMTDISADEAYERDGRVNVDMEPEALLKVLLSTPPLTADDVEPADEDVTVEG